MAWTKCAFGAAMVVATFAAGCPKEGTPPCTPGDVQCPAQQGPNHCREDKDCAGDGSCAANGVCVPRYVPDQQATACASVTCAPGYFCANGNCVPGSPQCRPPDPACIYIPRGQFEQPARAFWWPWITPDGPDAPSPNDRTRPDLEYPEFVQVMMTPVVMRLQPGAAPAIVFNTLAIDANAAYLENRGVMRAIDGATGAPLWTAPRDFWTNQDKAVNANSGIASGDCTGSGEVCFVTGAWDPEDVNPTDASKSHRKGGLIAFGSDGRHLWTNRDMSLWWGAPAIARLLGPTGPAQIVVGNGVVDGATGKTLCAQNNSTSDQISGNGVGSLSVVADIDLDGKPEILTGNNAYKLEANAASPTGYTCRALWGAGVRRTTGPCRDDAGLSDEEKKLCPDGFPAVANFAPYGALMGLNPADKHPQIVVVSKGTLRIQDWTGGLLLDPIPLPADQSCLDLGEPNLGGAPTIADFDGDDKPEIGIAGQGGYLMWKPGVNFVWRQRTRDCSSATGSSVFDFEGRNEALRLPEEKTGAQVVYADQCYLHVYDGRNGNVLAKEKNASCTAYEMPIVADTDGTGHAKIVIPANTICSYACDWGNQYESRQWGLKVLKSPGDKWVNTRSVWNQHTYHVTNVNLDGTLPFPEPYWWETPAWRNSFRQNVQGQGVFSAPDVSACNVDVDMTQCRTQGATVRTTVYNGGALLAKPGIDVHLYAKLANGQRVLIATKKTTTTMQPGAKEDLTFQWANPPQSQDVTLEVVVDEPGLVGDCHPENNVNTTAKAVRCSPIG